MKGLASKACGPVVSKAFPTKGLVFKTCCPFESKAFPIKALASIKLAVLSNPEAFPMKGLVSKAAGFPFPGFGRQQHNALPGAGL